MERKRRWAIGRKAGRLFVKPFRYANGAGDVEWAGRQAVRVGTCVSVVDVCMIIVRLKWGG